MKQHEQSQISPNEQNNHNNQNEQTAHGHGQRQEKTALVQQNVQHQSTLTNVAKNLVMSKHGMTEQQWALYDAEVSIGLLTLRTAFPTQARNYSDREHDVLTALWLEIFAEVEPGLLREAIMRFVATDRKGFFPSPGQVMGLVEDIRAERKRKEDEERAERHYAELREHQRRIDNGENCSTCRFSEYREVEVGWAKRKETSLFCLNPDSYKYVGEYGHGTAASILCEHYEPKSDDTDIDATASGNINSGEADIDSTVTKINESEDN